MVRISKTGSTMRQMAYARRVWGAKGEEKKYIALDVGYSPSMADKATEKIERTRGYNNAMAKLAQESNSIALQVMHELTARGFENYSNKDLVGALNAISGAWAKFNRTDAPKEAGNTSDSNRLRAIVIHQAEKEPVATYKEKPINYPMDF